MTTTNGAASPPRHSRTKAKLTAGIRVMDVNNPDCRGVVLTVKMWKNGKFRCQVLVDSVEKPQWSSEEFWEDEDNVTDSGTLFIDLWRRMSLMHRQMKEAGRDEHAQTLRNRWFEWCVKIHNQREKSRERS